MSKRRPSLVLFLPAVGGDSTFWEPQVEALRGTCSPLPIDLVRSASRVSMAGFAEDAMRAIVATGHEDAHLVGHSMGGVVALELYRRYPERVRSLTLANTWTFQPEGAARSQWVEEMLGKMTLAEFSRMNMPGLFAPETRQDIIERAVSVESRKEREAYLACWREMMKVDLRPVVPSIRVPVLLVGGEKDRLTPTRPLLTGIQKALPSARLVDLPGASHFSNLDRPEAFTKALREHLDVADTQGP
ncbi:alpha/beta fold hydrolase [Archangium lipolyticum]|uniref:alpha/beta fold hydrolase n=1 Tax=Archangium lipolyticum TaxID=2970465 RepID=UPI00214A47E9|nr:alpha/beta hydrolase [Archangium lipolyticum]